MKLKLKLTVGLLAITAALAGCSSDSAGEGEGEGTEGEGEEGEGEEGEGEGGDVEICDNGIDDNDTFTVDCAEPSCETDPACALDEVTADFGDQATPTTVDLPISEVVANPAVGGAECVAVTIPVGLFRLTATAENPRCLDGGGSGDVKVYVYATDATADDDTVSNDDGGEGNCSLLATTTLEPGDYVVCVAHFSYGNEFGTAQPLVATTFSVSVDALTIVAAGEDCSSRSALCDPEVADLECLSVDDPTDFRCVVQTTLQFGDACIPETTAAVCAFPSVCNAESSTCDTLFGAACLDATEATLGDNTITMPETSAVGGLSCFTVTNVFTYYRYTATVNGIVTANVSEGANVGIRQGCSDLSASCFDDEAAGTAGQDIVFSVEAPAGSMVTLTITETATVFLPLGAACVSPPIFGAAGAICDEGAYCGGATCIEAAPLELDVPAPFSSVDGTPSELCFAFTEAGSYTLETTGDGCDSSDTHVRVLSNGVPLVRDDDGGEGACSLLTLTVEEGNYLACVAHYTLDGDVADVNFTVTRE